jgi:alpha-aminoadipate carrier protein LysW
MPKVECPSCFFEFKLGEGTFEGEIIPCPDCGVDLKVLKIESDTAVVKDAELTEEDWGE